MQTITSIFKSRVERDRNAIAIIDWHGGQDRVWTYETLDHQAGLAASRLTAQGISRGDPVLVFVPVSAELYACLLALFEIGAVAVFLDPSAGRNHMDRCCRLIPPSAFIGSLQAHLLRFGSSALRRIPLHLTTGRSLWGATALFSPGDEKDIRPSSASPDDPALITFTSGSTGEPKAAVRSHQFLIAQHRILEKCIELRGGEVDLPTLPVFVLANLASGVTSVLPDADLRKPGSIRPDPVLGQIRRHGVTRTVGSPAFFQRLLEGSETHITALKSIGRIYTGGAPVFPGFLEKLHKAMPGATVVAVYGSTEAEPIAHIEFQQVTDLHHQQMIRGRGLLVGPPVEEIQLRIIPDQWGTPIGPYTAAEFESLSLKAGATGEIVVSGRHVLSGYLDGRGDEETKFRVGEHSWHRTGDAGSLDSEGNLWLSGRCAARIGGAHGNLYPFSVETAVSQFPWIARSALVEIDQRRILAIQCGKPPSANEMNQLEKSLEWAGVDMIKRMKRIPVDSRHNAKVNYPDLERRLRHEGRPTAVR